MTNLVPLPQKQRLARRIFFTRRELSQLLTRYSTKVASGEWRDYAIDHEPRRAVFSIFRSSYERPVYAIVKHAPSREIEYALFARAHKLPQSSSLDEGLQPIGRRCWGAVGS